jgi:DNA transformation protein
MAVSEGDLGFVLDQLAGLGGVRSKRMFGGVGLYAAGPDGGERIFALMDDGVLYFKADDLTRARYTRRRLKPFQPPGSPPSKNYYTVPASVLEDAGELVAWARESIAAADRAAAAKSSATSRRGAKARPAARGTTPAGRRR